MSLMPDADTTGPAQPADFILALAALRDMTPSSTIGPPLGSIDEGEGTYTVYFDSTMVGYPGWRWTVSIAHVEGAEPTVLETELTPGDTALLSPDWVPWSDRLADYQAAQEAAGLDASVEGADDSDDDSDDGDSDDDDEHDDDDDDDDDDEHDDDFDDDDADERVVPVTHGGDLDGVDIDSIDVDDDSEDEDEDEDEEDDDDDSDDDESDDDDE